MKLLALLPLALGLALRGAAEPASSTFPCETCRITNSPTQIANSPNQITNSPDQITNLPNHQLTKSDHQLTKSPNHQMPQAPLQPMESNIVAAVDRNNDAALALLQRVVDINSGTMNLAGVRRVGDVFRAEFDALGFRTRGSTGRRLAARDICWRAAAGKAVISCSSAISIPSSKPTARSSGSSACRPPPHAGPASST